MCHNLSAILYQFKKKINWLTLRLIFFAYRIPVVSLQMTGLLLFLFHEYLVMSGDVEHLYPSVMVIYELH